MADQARIDELRKSPVPPQKLFIAGTWQEGQDTPRAVTSPIDGQDLTTIQSASAEDVDRAVRSARAAFEDGRWSGQAPGARKKLLLKIAEKIEARAVELAVLGVRDNGTEFGMALKAEPGSAAASFRYYAEAIDKIAGEIAPTAPGILGLVHREPVGVVGVIVPWNMPLMIGAWKIAPALAMGNSVVIKPAESASLTLLALAEIAAECGLPDGVLNVVTGRGSVTGDALAHHMDVDVLAFTGSGGTGRRLLQASAASNLKRVFLELGGKSPNIVFADTKNLAEAAKVTVNGIFRNSGQICIAGSRLLVERSMHAEFVSEVSRMASQLRVGDPLDLSNDVGAVHSEDQLETILSFTRGSDCTTGGARILQETGGTYMAPTVIDNVSASDRVFTEEVFGPVLAVTSFSTEAEAIALANATEYGLAAAVWTSDLSRAHKMVSSIKAGLVHVNTYGGSDLTVPLGGVKQSGNGHDKSLHAFDKYTDLKSAWIKL